METLHHTKEFREFASGLTQPISKLTGHFIPSGRKGFISPFTAIGAIVVIGAVVFGATKLAQDDTPQNLQFINEAGQVVDEEGMLVEGPAAINAAIADACPDTKVVNLQLRATNSKKSGSVEYLNQTFYLITESGGNDPLSQSAGNATTGAYPTAITPVCDGKTSYTIEGVATNETSWSTTDEIGLLTTSVKKTYEVEKFGRVKTKAKDILGDAWAYDDSTYDTDASNTDYDYAPITFQNVTATSATVALGADEDLQWEFWLKTDASAQFGEDELPMYFAVDADLTDYDTPSLTYGTAGLTDIKNTGELNNVDLSVLSGYEYVFRVPDGQRITSANSVLDFYIRSKSGVDPDVDIKIRPLAVTRYLGQDGVTVKTGIFKDDSTNTEAGSGLSQEITIDIS